METLGQELERISKILIKKQNTDVSSYTITNRSKHSIDIEYYQNLKDNLIIKIAKYGRNHIEGSNTSPQQVNRKSRVVISY